METTFYKGYVDKFFKGVVIGVVDKLNDSTRPLPYLHKTLLRPEFSSTGKWESIIGENSLVAADVVAMDSQLPLKKNGTITPASGDIPKMGSKKALTESQLTAIDTMIALNQPEQRVASKLFDHTSKVIGAIYERNEAMLLQGLSTGKAIVEDDENVGADVQVDYKYLAGNKKGVSVLWNTDFDTAPSVDNIERLISDVNGIAPQIAYMDRATFNLLSKTKQIRDVFAMESGFTGSVPGTPSLERLNPAIQDRWGFKIQIVDRKIRYEKNGTQKIVSPWKAGQIVFAPAGVIGTLVYAQLAEENHKVTGVEYTKPTDYMLVSKYRTNSPLAEFTESQARVVPIINNVQDIYILDTTTVQA